SPDGKHLVSSSSDKTIRVWNADGTGEPLVLRGHLGGISTAAYSPDGLRIVSSSLDQTIRVWNADGTGEPMVLRGHETPVKSATFGREGRHVAGAFEEGAGQVWADVEPLHSVDDPRLWTATDYCPPLERRMELLHVSQAMAGADRERCLLRVAQAHAPR